MAVLWLDAAHLKSAALWASQPEAYSGNEGAFLAAYGNNAATSLLLLSLFLSQVLGSRAVLT
jgi:hypothetical protein